MGVVVKLEVLGNWLHFDCDNQAQRNGQPYNHEEGSVPSPAVGNYQADGNSKNLACSKSHLSESKYSASLLHVKQVCNDCHSYRADHTPEQSGNYSGKKQECIGI